MEEISDTKRAVYTLEFKIEAVRLNRVWQGGCGHGKPPSKAANRRISYKALLAQIRAIHTEVRGEYGWPKI